MHPLDVFIKNTHEGLGPLHRVTAYDRLTQFDYLSGDRNVRRAVYESGVDATTVIVNFGATDAEVTSELGGRTILPPWGFVVEGPPCCLPRQALERHGLRAGSVVHAPGDRRQTSQGICAVRVFHAFGPSTLSWQGQAHEVRREERIEQRLQ
jgi:hypothetical protein